MLIFKPIILQIKSVLDQLPSLDLGGYPSPIRRLDRCSDTKRMGMSVGEVYLKDDGALNSIYGGNKIRKLELILAEALRRGEQRVWTVGGIGSHHALATALHGHQQGVHCHIFHVPQPVNAHVISTLTALLTTSPTLTLAQPPEQGESAPASLKRQLKSWLQRGQDELGRAPFFIPSGGSSLLGTLGYLRAAFELFEDIQQGRLPQIKAIYVPAGTCSTLAGLALGVSILNLEIELVGVQVVPRYLANTKVVERLILEAITFINSQGIELPISGHRYPYRLLKGYLGAGYGHMTAQGEEAMELAAQDELKLDPIYTSKTMAALLEEERDRCRPVLFWNTLSSADLTQHTRGKNLEGLLNTLPSTYDSALGAL